MSTLPDYYEILEVHPNSSQEIIKEAYLTLSKRYHPDSTILNKKLAQEQFELINEAYEILSNPSERKKYDNIRAQNKSSNHESHHANNKTLDSNKSYNWHLILGLLIPIIFIISTDIIPSKFNVNPPVKNNIQSKNHLKIDFDHLEKTIIIPYNSKKYINDEYKFSIYIPDNLTYIRPTDNNTKMNAMDISNGTSIGVVITPFPAQQNSDDTLLRQLPVIHRELYPTLKTVISRESIISTPRQKMYLTVYTIPTSKEDKIILYTFQFINNYRYFEITYGTPAHLAKKQEKLFIESINTFNPDVDYNYIS